MNPTAFKISDDSRKLPLIPTEGAPDATAAKAYSICTNFPDGLRTDDKVELLGF